MTDAAKKLGNEPAFPCFQGKDAQTCDPGLTKREWIAGMIIQGLIAAQPPGGSGRINAIDQNGKTQELGLCIASVCLADTMLYELSKPQ